MHRWGLFVVSRSLLCSHLPPFLISLLCSSPPSTLRETPSFSPECDMNCGTCGLHYVEVCSLYPASNESFGFCHVYLLIYLCAYEAGIRATLCVWRSKDNLWGLVSPSILWVPGIELMLPALASSAFSCCAVLQFHGSF